MTKKVSEYDREIPQSISHMQQTNAQHHEEESQNTKTVTRHQEDN